MYKSFSIDNSLRRDTLEIKFILMVSNNFTVSSNESDGDYVCTLPPKFAKLAETELQETESKRSQSLEQLRDWISKHPEIQSCRTGI